MDRINKSDYNFTEFKYKYIELCMEQCFFYNDFKFWLSMSPGEFDLSVYNINFELSPKERIEKLISFYTMDNLRIDKNWELVSFYILTRNKKGVIIKEEQINVDYNRFIKIIEAKSNIKIKINDIEIYFGYSESENIFSLVESFRNPKEVLSAKRFSGKSINDIWECLE